MKSKAILMTSLLGAVLITPLMTGGCVSSSKVTTTESVGQQLQDLEKAYKDGIISQDQYEKLKKKIVRENQ